MASGKEQDSCTYELSEIVTAHTIPVQVQGRPNPSVGSQGVIESYLLQRICRKLVVPRGLRVSFP